MNNKLPYMNEARVVALSPDERRLLRGRIVDYMFSHPLSQSPSLVTFFRQYWLLAASTSFVLLFGVFSYALELSEPGTYLYGTKTGIEDTLTSLFTSSPESEIEWDINAAERRMQEIEELAADLGW